MVNMINGLISNWIWKHDNLVEKIALTNNALLEFSENVYWIRDSKSFSSTGNELCGKGFTFSFHTYKNGNFRLHRYALYNPMLTKAFPWPFQRDFTPLVNDWKSYSMVTDADSAVKSYSL